MTRIPIRLHGFTIIEMMVAIAIISILLAASVSGLRNWMSSAQIRNAADSIQSGLQLARSEAVRRNAYTQFILTDGNNWRVIQINPPTSGIACGEVSQIQVSAGNEGSASAGLTVSPAGATTITFTPLGWTLSDRCGTLISQIDIATIPTVSGLIGRALRVAITASGGIRMCDPALATGDPRACTL
jgi:type IV fimbrial biogenesis protein FimT